MVNKNRRTLEDKINKHLLKFAFGNNKQAYGKYNQECRKYVEISEGDECSINPSGVNIGLMVAVSQRIAQEAKKNGKL